MGGWERKRKKRKGSADLLQMVLPDDTKAWTLLDLRCAISRTPDPNLALSTCPGDFCLSFLPKVAVEGEANLQWFIIVFNAVFPIRVMDTGNVCMTHWSPKTSSAAGLKGSLSLHIVALWRCRQAHCLGNCSLHGYSRCGTWHNFFLPF